LAPPWANCLKSGLLDITPCLSIYIYITDWELKVADGSGTTTTTVPTDDTGHIPPIYEDFEDIFSKATAEANPSHASTDHAIDLDPS
jgi:hypothetical protein